MTEEDRIYIDRLREADKKYYEAQMKSNREYFDAEIRAVRRAVDIYNASNNERWTGANEFRAQLKDQAGTFLTRKELWLAGTAIIGIVLTLVSLLIKGK